jgi:hypothetical protein
MNAQNGPSPIADAARKRGISRLIHFTPAENLIGMIGTGNILPQQELLAYARIRKDAFLLDYIRINDALRYDGRRDCINLSIQHPNAYLFRRFREQHKPCDLWVVLTLPVECLDIPGTVFTTGNAASSHVRKHGTATGIDGFEALFSDHLISANMQGSRTLARGVLASQYPTDIQAEVLLPAPVDLMRIVSFSVENEEHARRLTGMFRCTSAIALSDRVTVEPDLFGERKG